jgi:hypothetical protein
MLNHLPPPLILTFVFLVCSLACVAQSEYVRIGSIDFFGTAGINVPKARTQVSPHESQNFSWDAIEPLQLQLKNAIASATGHPATDAAVVCCNSNGELMLYIGLGGANSHSVPHLPAPQGSSCLPQTALDLYDRAMDVNMKAVQSGDEAEDDSLGYALGHNPQLRRTQLEMREFALDNLATIEAALRDCSQPKHRRAAAELLGYADTSSQQVSELVRASEDSDGTVRNNAVRALEVLSSSKRVEIPGESFIPLLNSDQWTDRNKAGLLFMHLTSSGDSKLLSALANQSFDSLAEMARWKDKGHAIAYRIILGRIAGLSQKLSEELVNDGRTEELIAAAQKKR